MNLSSNLNKCLIQLSKFSFNKLWTFFAMCDLENFVIFPCTEMLWVLQLQYPHHVKISGCCSISLRIPNLRFPSSGKNGFPLHLNLILHQHCSHFNLKMYTNCSMLNYNWPADNRYLPSSRKSLFSAWCRIIKHFPIDTLYFCSNSQYCNRYYAFTEND